MSQSRRPVPVMTDTEGQKIFRKLKSGQAVFTASFVALLLLFTSLNIIRPEGSITLWLVQSVPLLIFVPGLYRQRFRSYSWVCFVILPYFTWSVVNTMSPFIRWTDVVVLILSSLIFLSAMMVSRWLQYWHLYQHQTAQAQQDSGATESASSGR